jgi:hypothetical protein
VLMGETALGPSDLAVVECPASQRLTAELTKPKIYVSRNGNAAASSSTPPD